MDLAQLHRERLGRMGDVGGSVLHKVNRLTRQYTDGNLECATAERLFARFLQRPRGRLFGGWGVLPDTAEFMRFSSHHGFFIAPTFD
jgi:hypothetical protein